MVGEFWWSQKAEDPAPPWACWGHWQSQTMSPPHPLAGCPERSLIWPIAHRQAALIHKGSQHIRALSPGWQLSLFYATTSAIFPSGFWNMDQGPSLDSNSGLLPQPTFLLFLPRATRTRKWQSPPSSLPWLSHLFWLQKATDIFYKLKQQYNSP